MTVFNAEEYLPGSLNSLFDQEFQDFEVIVLEHGSTDKSLDILNAWGDPRLDLETMEFNIGRTSALNRCLSRANGEFVAILDADDLAHPQRFGLEIEYLNANPEVGLIGTWSKFIDQNGCEVGSSHPPISHEKLVKQLAIRDPIVHSSVMFRRKIAVEIGGYDESYIYAQDFKLIIEFAKRSRIAVINEELCSWRKIASSLTSSKDLQIARAFDEYRLFRKISSELNFDSITRLLNLKQRILTTLILKAALLRSGIFDSIQNWRFQHGT